MKTTPALGTHVIADLYGISPTVLNDLPFLESLVLQLVEDSGAIILDSRFRRFQPQGVTGIVIVAESHFSFHTWPEHSYMAVDYFTCGTKIDPLQMVNALIRKLEPSIVSVDVKKRGGLIS